MVVEAGTAGYRVPLYRAPSDAVFFHVLHGHVPGHQIDFMYAPEVPTGLLTPTHYSHLTRLMKYIEPQPGAPYAFSIANLSRDDTQFEPGHGGVGIILGLRIEGAVDHTGRHDPPFAHGLMAVDRELQADVLEAASQTLLRRTVVGTGGGKDTAAFYSRYVQCCTTTPEQTSTVLAEYVNGFSDLPSPPRSTLSFAWKAPASGEVPRVVILYDDDAPFDFVARLACRIAAVLYRTNIRWTQVSTGGERDLPGGVTVRLVMRRNAPAAVPGGLLLDAADVPGDDEAIAQRLFGAESAVEVKAQVQGWRERFAYHEPGERQTFIPAAPAGAVAPVRNGPRPEEITRVAPFQPVEPAPGLNGEEVSGRISRASAPGAAPSNPGLAPFPPSTPRFVAAPALSPVFPAQTDVRASSAGEPLLPQGPAAAGGYTPVGGPWVARAPMASLVEAERRSQSIRPPVQGPSRRLVGVLVVGVFALGAALLFFVAAAGDPPAVPEAAGEAAEVNEPSPPPAPSASGAPEIAAPPPGAAAGAPTPEAVPSGPTASAKPPSQAPAGSGKKASPPATPKGAKSAERAKGVYGPPVF